MIDTKINMFQGSLILESRDPGEIRDFYWGIVNQVSPEGKRIGSQFCIEFSRMMVIPLGEPWTIQRRGWTEDDGASLCRDFVANVSMIVAQWNLRTAERAQS